MNKKAYLYCDSRSLNEATNYYVDIIRKAFIKARDYQYEVVTSISQIKNPEIIITITEKYFIIAKISFPKAKAVYWSQGVSAEEAKIYIKDFKSLMRFCFRRLVEPIAINRSDILFCVSKKMVDYYKKTYNLKNESKVIIMPCYNMPLTLSNHDLKRYEKPHFVYAGNSSSWQCIDTMLDVYKYVEDRIDGSKLFLYTGDKDIFISKIKVRNIKNFEIKYVSVDILQKELEEYKYGFVLRDSHIINQVATPTKMNSYLASLLIPIFSDGVDDFQRNIQLGQFTLMGKCPLDVASVGKKIVEFEKNVRDFSKFKKEVQKIFQQYYNTDMYIDQIREKIENA